MLKRICIALCIVCHLFSCGNVLDIEPETMTTYTNYFKGEKDAAALLYNTMGKSVVCYLKYHPQEVVGMKVDVINDSRYENIREWSLNALSVSWGDFYTLIYSCNLLIDNAYRFEEIEPERLDFYVQQAKFVRAYTYYELVRRWGDVPVIPNSTTTNKYGKTDKLKVLEEEVIKVAESLDLPVFAELVGEDGESLSSKQYACKGTVMALLAHAYAWKAGLTGDNKDWEQAEAYCSKIINGEAGYYALAADPQEVCEKVMRRGSDESIFEIEYFMADDQYFFREFYAAVELMLGYPVDKTMLPSDETSLQITKGLVQEIYGDTINDRRVKAYFAFVEDEPIAYLKKWNFPVYQYNEYLQEDEYKLQDINRVVWRLADIKLLRAECRARLGRADAAEDLNDIRARAYGDRSHDYTAAEGDIRLAIFRERERELLYEGHRFFDVMRNGYWKTELTGAFAIMSEEEFAKGAQYYPVHENAFNLNDLMIQNEYWQTKQ